MPAPFRAALAAFRRYRQGRKTYQILAQMTQRELDDIGLTRGDLKELAWGSPAKTGAPKARATKTADAAGLAALTAA